MTPKDTIIYSIIPNAEGLLEGTILGMLEIDCFNKDGASKTLKNVIKMLHKIKELLETENYNR